MEGAYIVFWECCDAPWQWRMTYVSCYVISKTYIIWKRLLWMCWNVIPEVNPVQLFSSRCQTTNHKHPPDPTHAISGSQPSFCAHPAPAMYFSTDLCGSTSPAPSVNNNYHKSTPFCMVHGFAINMYFCINSRNIILYSDSSLSR